MWDEAEFICAFCGEKNYLQIDPTAAFEQEFEEDCQVCCQPNVVHVVFDPQNLRSEVWAEMEAE